MQDKISKYCKENNIQNLPTLKISFDTRILIVIRIFNLCKARSIYLIVQLIYLCMLYSILLFLLSKIGGQKIKVKRKTNG